VIESAWADPHVLWPPNHKMVKVIISAVVYDEDPGPTWRIAAVASTEPESGLAGGDPAPDWEILTDHTVNLRAERFGTGEGRTYTVTIEATDASGRTYASQDVRGWVMMYPRGGSTTAICP